MTKKIDLETFVYDILQKSKYAMVYQYGGLYEVRDDYTDRNNEGESYALVSIEDDSDVIVLANYLDIPGCKITYNDSYGMPTFDINPGSPDSLELTFFQSVRLPRN